MLIDYILTLTIFLPAFGALFILIFVRGNENISARNARQTALAVSVVTFLLSLLIIINFDPSSAATFQLTHRLDWLPSYGIFYHVGVDGISVWFVLLSTLLTPICILASWDSITKRVKDYMISFLVLETLMVGMFCALDFVLFYLFFEAVLIPMYLIIGVWGGENRTYAAFKFFLYTLIGSVLMLVAIIRIGDVGGSFDIPTLLRDLALPAELQVMLWLAFFASFAVKVPMWPVHTWLPDAHVQAPTAGSVILAGVLLKMGGYGFIRFSIPLLPDATVLFTPFVYTLSVIAVVYTSLVALAQADMKKLIAYSSVAHMGYVTLGLFTLTSSGMTGAMFQMLSHGVVSAALFLCVGVVYDRMHTRNIGSYGGLVQRMPRYALVFMIFMLASVGLPGTSGFVGEFLVLLGAFQVNTWVALLAGSGLILGAVYMLFLYRRVIFGKLENKELFSILDLSRREVMIFAPLAVLVLWMGIYPSTFIDSMAGAIDNIIAHHQERISASSKTGVTWSGLMLALGR